MISEHDAEQNKKIERLEQKLDDFITFFYNFVNNDIKHLKQQMWWLFTFIITTLVAVIISFIKS